MQLVESGLKHVTKPGSSLLYKWHTSVLVDRTDSVQSVTEKWMQGQISIELSSFESSKVPVQMRSKAVIMCWLVRPEVLIDSMQHWWNDWPRKTQSTVTSPILQKIYSWKMHKWGGNFS
jgi:hypothetical protein